MLYVNLFADGDCLLEPEPQGNASQPVNLPACAEATLREMASGPEASAALARLFLAGVTAGERAVRH